MKSPSGGAVSADRGSPGTGVSGGARLRLLGVLALLVLLFIYFFLYSFLGTRVRYIFIILMASAFALLVFSRPGSWLPVLPFIFVLGGPTFPMGDFNPAIGTLVMIGFSVFFIIDRTLRNEPLSEPSPYLRVLLLAVLVQTVSVFTSIHLHGQHATNAIRDGSSLYLFFPLAVMIPALCTSREDIRRLHRGIVLAVLFASFLGVIEYFSITSFERADIGIGYVYRGRVASLFGNPNIFAGYLELGIPPSIALFFMEKRSGWKTVALAAAILSVMSVLYTFSRGGLLAACVGGGMTLLYVFRRKVWLFMLFAVAALTLLFLSMETFDRQISFFRDPGKTITQPTILHRIVTYRGYVQQFSDSPITGQGYGAKEHYWGRSRLYSFWEVRFARSTGSIQGFGGLNSLLLNNAVKGGIISVLSLVLMFGAIYAAFFSAMGRERANGLRLLAVSIAAGTFSFMLHSIVDNTIRFPTVNSLFWCNIGLLLAIAVMGRRTCPEQLPFEDVAEPAEGPRTHQGR